MGRIVFGKMRLGDVGFQGKKALMRVDYNGVTKNGAMDSTKRVTVSLPSIKHALSDGVGQLFLMSHNGRFKDIQKDPRVFTMEPIAPYLSQVLGIPVDYVHGFDSPINSSARVVVLGNTREDARDESKNTEENQTYARQILSAVNPDIYGLDGFSVAHRDQGSVTWPAILMKAAGKPAVAGELLYTEYDFFVNKVIDNPARPFLVFLGGAKVDTKMPTLAALLPNVDGIVLGGAMVYPFMLEMGMRVENADPFAGKDGRAQELREEREKAASILHGEYADKVIIPNMIVGANSQMMDASTAVIPVGFGMKDTLITNLVPQLVAGQYKTIFFNGAFGAFEPELGGHIAGTQEVFAFMNQATLSGACTIPGGGDTMTALKALKKAGYKFVFTWETTGGGASGDLLVLGFKGTPELLPGFACLSDKN